MEALPPGVMVSGLWHDWNAHLTRLERFSRVAAWRIDQTL